VIALLLACASPGPVVADYGASSCAEWAEVPTRDGRVVTCSEARVVIRVEGQHVQSELDQFRTALLAGGWTIESDASTTTEPAIRWVRGDDRVVLGIVTAEGATVATVARVGR
jgi:hypothetical protein